MPTTEGAAICPACGETATHYCRCTKAILSRGSSIATKGVVDPSCSTCRFARGTVCCAHPVTVKMPAARWCGEHQEKQS